MVKLTVILIILGISLSVLLYVYINSIKTFGGIVVRKYIKKLTYPCEGFIETYYIVIQVKVNLDGSLETGIIEEVVEVSRDQYKSINLLDSISIKASNKSIVFVEKFREIYIDGEFKNYLDVWGNRYIKEDDGCIKQIYNWKD